MCMYMYVNDMLIICVGTSTFYSKAFESRSGKAASKQIMSMSYYANCQRGSAFFMRSTCLEQSTIIITDVFI